MSAAIQLYYFPSPNGRKTSIALEEMALPYEVRFVNILGGAQNDPTFLAVSPNGRIPALTDGDVRLFESGAILQYLGRKSGRFYATDEAKRAEIDAWLFWQVAGLGPMTSQINWFARAAEKPGRNPNETSLALHRFKKEVKRLYAVLDRQLAGRDFICGDYSIADMACWPWVDRYHDRAGALDDFPNIKAWHARIAARAAVQRALLVAIDQANALKQSAADQGFAS